MLEHQSSYSYIMGARAALLQELSGKHSIKKLSFLRCHTPLPSAGSLRGQRASHTSGSSKGSTSRVDEVTWCLVPAAAVMHLHEAW